MTSGSKRTGRHVAPDWGEIEDESDAHDETTPTSEIPPDPPPARQQRKRSRNSKAKASAKRKVTRTAKRSRPESERPAATGPSGGAQEDASPEPPKPNGIGSSNGEPNGNGDKRSSFDDLSGLRAEAQATIDQEADEPPIKLFPEVGEAAVYPVHALGPLADAVRAAARSASVDPALGAQSALALAALATMGHANVVPPHGEPRPLILYTLTVALSGERKSKIDKLLTRAIADFERDLGKRHKAAMATFLAQKRAFEASAKHIERDRKLTPAAREKALEKLGPMPVPPREPVLVADDMTLEALLKRWASFLPIHGLFSNEGGIFVAGAGMSDDLRYRSTATLNSLWDGKDIKRNRATVDEALVPVVGKRFSLSVMVQPVYAQGFVDDEMLRSQGIIPRLLIAWPLSRIGSRSFQQPRREDNLTLARFRDHVLRLLSEPLPIVDGNALDPRGLPIKGKAAKRWITYHDKVEALAATVYSAIAGTATKSAEQAARIAGILTMFADLNAKEVSSAAMQNGIELAQWYLDEACRVHFYLLRNDELMAAQTLLEWLWKNPQQRLLRDVLRHAPRRFRTKASLEKALKILADHKWVLDWAKGKRTAKPFTVRECPDA